MRLFTTCVVAICIIGVASSIQDAPVRSSRVSVYDADPNHLWNRIHGCFRVRVAPDGSEYGVDTIDPLLWRETKYLLTAPSHATAVSLLDEFLTSNGERLIRDPLKRAVFQHDLWAIFDWLASTSEGDKPARAALMQRIARVIRRVALSRKDIEALPDNYMAAVASGAFSDRSDASPQKPFLPRDLSGANGRWVSVGGTHPVVPQHAAELSRSAFIVLWNLPGGRAATLAYLRRVWDFPQPFVRNDRFPNDGEVGVTLNPALPPVPDGTRIALVRKMLLIDDAGDIVPSKVVQSIQFRLFPGREGFSEVMMSREDLFARKPVGLRETSGDDLMFLTFSSHGIDSFEHQQWRRPRPFPRAADRCATCHQVGFEAGIATVRSVRALLRPNPLVDTRHERWARWLTQPIVAADAKKRSYEWGVLEGLWQAQPR